MCTLNLYIYNKEKFQRLTNLPISEVRDKIGCDETGCTEADDTGWKADEWRRKADDDSEMMGVGEKTG